MSVTFTAEYIASDFDGWAVTHAGTEDRFSVVFNDREDAVQALVEHNDTCDRDLCRMYNGQVDAVSAIPDPAVNMSSANARFVLDALGYGTADDLTGECEADVFLGRVMLAQAISPVDEGVPSHVLPGRGVQVIECGRPSGYLADRLTVLGELAQCCRAHDRAVAWA
ncbi:MAG: hypothetical protein M3Y35_00690 [Actinomycetota bacterium]|nr:hypothetical protein [Actinomycetota bacterium]